MKTYLTPSPAGQPSLPTVTYSQKYAGELKSDVNAFHDLLCELREGAGKSQCNIYLMT